MSTRENGLEKLLFQLSPYGYLELESASELIETAGIELTDFCDYIKSPDRAVNPNPFELNICFRLYEYILETVRVEVEASTGVDISEETNIGIHSADLLTGFYLYDEDVLSIVTLVPENDRSQLLQWFIEEIRSTLKNRSQGLRA